MITKIELESGLKTIYCRLSQTAFFFIIVQGKLTKEESKNAISIHTFIFDHH